MNKNTDHFLQMNVSKIFTITLAIDSLFDVLQKSNQATDDPPFRDTLSQIKWISTEITKVEKDVNCILDEHQHNRVTISLRAAFNKMPQQLDKIQCEAIHANLGMINGDDIEEDLNNLSATLYDLRNTVFRSYSSLSALKAEIETP